MAAYARPMPSYALAGSGTMAAIWAQVIATTPGHDLRAVASRQHEHAVRLASAYRCAAVEPEHLAAADVVVVASAPPAHCDDALRAAADGAAVVVEAPLCTTLADADLMVDAAADGARLAYGEHLLFAPLVRDALRRVAALGPFDYLEARVLQQRPIRRSAFDAGWGGGVLFDLGAHALAVLLTAAGTDRPVSVQARLDPMRPDADAVDDQATVELTFASGARGTLELSWRAPTPQWSLQVATPASAFRLELLPDPHLEQLGVDLPRPPRRRPELEPAQLETFGYLDHLLETGDELAGGADPYVPVGLGRYVLDVLCGAYRSARTGAAEPLPFTGDRRRTPWQLWRTGP